MCGIAGTTTNLSFLTESLEILQSRGYDGYGYYYDGKMYKYLGYDISYKLPVTDSKAGLCHTAWKTHGNIDKNNLQPIKNGNAVIVHNGIIPRHLDIINETKGLKLNTETDSEIIAAVIDFYRNLNLKPETAFSLTIDFLKNHDPSNSFGSFLYLDENGAIYGYGDLYFSGCYISNDVRVLDKCSETVYKLQSGYVVLDKKTIKVVGECKEYKNPKKTEYVKDILEEIKEQVKLVNNALPYSLFKFLNGSNVDLIGCGSSYNAAVYGSLLDEGLCAKYPAHPNIKHEYLAISQSGETFDLLKTVKAIGPTGTVLTNNKHSTLTNYVQRTVEMNAGPEYSVAATKTFTMSCVRLYELIKGDFDRKELSDAIDLATKTAFPENIIRILENTKSLYILGNHLFFPFCLESALKFQELCYIHSSGLLASEIKHGPLALVNDVPSIIFDYNGDMESTISQIKIRKGQTIVVSNRKECDILVPSINNEFLQPLVYNILMQVLAVTIGKNKGINVERPRNLSKSITV